MGQDNDGVGSAFVKAYPAMPQNVGIARRAVTEFLAQTDPGDLPIGDIALALSEAFTNVVYHAYVGQRLGEARVRVDVAAEEVVLTVEDDGRGMMPRPDTPGLGLGLPTIATLAKHFDVSTTARKGTRVRATFARDPA